MKMMSIPLCAVIIASGALAGCGDGASDSATVSGSNSQSDTAAQSQAQPSANAAGLNTSRVALDVTPAHPSVPPVSDPRSALATNAPIDPPSPPTAMSPGVIASVDPTPLVSRPANYTVFAAQSADDPEVQVQPVVHYAPESSDSQ
jgi:hypothetical protein